MERSDYKSGTVISHSFTDKKMIQDFPLRGKPVYLHVRRRRWYDKATGETFSYTYDDLTAEGTKLTPEFVTFLKEERGKLALWYNKIEKLGYSFKTDFYISLGIHKRKAPKIIDFSELFFSLCSILYTLRE